MKSLQCIKNCEELDITLIHYMSTLDISSIQVFIEEACVSFLSHSLHNATTETAFHPKNSSKVGTKYSALLLQINDLHFKQVYLVKLLQNAKVPFIFLFVSNVTLVACQLQSSKEDIKFQNILYRN